MLGLTQIVGDDRPGLVGILAGVDDLSDDLDEIAADEVAARFDRALHDRAALRRDIRLRPGVDVAGAVAIHFDAALAERSAAALRSRARTAHAGLLGGGELGSPFGDPPLQPPRQCPSG